MIKRLSRSMSVWFIVSLTAPSACEAYIKHLNRVIQERIDNRQIKPKRPTPVDLCGQLKAEGKNRMSEDGEMAINFS